jgi:Ca-activated chloride channel family protein
LLITDSEVSDAELDLAGELAGEGLLVSVLAVGTEQGAPIPQAEGGFVNDALGQVAVPRVDPARLQRLAARGGGRFARLAPPDRDLDALFPSASALPLDVSLESDAGEQYEADVWRDRGVWLAVALLPLLALCFRRGWIAVWLLVFLVPAPRADALEWRDLWKRADQRGFEELQQEQPARAAELFKNPEWRGAAEYRAGAFEASAATLAAIDTAEASYNRGNALARSGELEAAIGAYDRALELMPDHADARYNRDLVEQFLKDNPNAQQPPPNQGEGEQGQQGDSGEPQSGEQQDGEQSADEQQGEQGEPGDSQAGDNAQEPRDDEAQGEPQGEEQQANAGEEATDDSSESQPAPRDVEQWASEQAAEQWLRRVPQDPGGLLRRKFLYQYQRLGVDQNGDRVLDGAAAERKAW